MNDDMPQAEDLDLITAILRIRQAYRDEAMRDFLVSRLMTCDVPRLMNRLTESDRKIIGIMEYD